MFNRPRDGQPPATHTDLTQSVMTGIGVDPDDEISAPGLALY
jgi:hypothetical protein